LKTCATNSSFFDGNLLLLPLPLEGWGQGVNFSGFMGK
jgi:hypothetical protein